MSKKTKKIVSAKRVVYAELDDEITTLFDKVKNLPAKNIFVVIPQHAQIFQSVINLKILKRKLDEKEKNLHLVTNDSKGIALAQRLGIEVYDRIAADKPSFFPEPEKEEDLRLTPLKASINIVDEKSPTRLIERKLTISELLKVKGKKRQINMRKPAVGQLLVKDSDKEKQRLVLVAPNRQALIALSVFSVLVLVVVAYIALPGATIYLTPTASVLEKSVNIVLADAKINSAELATRPPNMIPSHTLTIESKLTIAYQATGKRVSERGANAQGKITIYNNSDIGQPLVKDTRFQTEEGLVFRIKGDLHVPAHSQIEAFVMADEVDATGALVGKRGNVGPGKFFLPGLRDEKRELIYAESFEPMVGGITDFVTFVTDGDIAAAPEKMKEALKQKAIEDLRLEVARLNEEGKETATEFVLLEDDKIIKLGEPSMPDVSQYLGQEISEFEISGSVSVKAVYYDRLDMINILQNELLSKKSPRKELLRVNEDSTSYRIFEINEQLGKIKMTANIKGIEQFAIDEDTDAGRKLLDKIRDHIAGREVSEANDFIRNLPEINKVEIDSWPFWAPTVPKIRDNIEFEIRDAALVK